MSLGDRQEDYLQDIIGMIMSINCDNYLFSGSFIFDYMRTLHTTGSLRSPSAARTSAGHGSEAGTSRVNPFSSATACMRRKTWSGVRTTGWRSASSSAAISSGLWTYWMPWQWGKLTPMGLAYARAGQCLQLLREDSGHLPHFNIREVLVQTSLAIRRADRQARWNIR